MDSTAWSDVGGMRMTFRELRAKLNIATEEELDQDATVYVRDFDEWFNIEGTKVTEESDVLDEGHLYMETV